MHLILTGGGESHHFSAIDQYFISQLPQEATLLYIPLAQEAELWKQGLNRIHETFSSIHFSNIEMCSDLSVLNWDELCKFSAIYIDGGNTFDLMSEIHGTHTYELLRKFLHHGGLINGDSAGAIVLGSHLETAHFGDEGDDNDTDVVSYQGLNFLGDWAIHCHYEDSQDKEILDFNIEYGFPVIALYENSAIAIKDGQIMVVGENTATIFQNGDKKTVPVSGYFTL